MNFEVPARGKFGLVNCLRLFFGLLPLIAMIRQLTVHLSLGFEAANFFSYYTTLSNLLAGCVLLLCAVPATIISDRSLETLRVIAAINMALVGIVFAILLRNSDVGSLLPWVNFVHHYLMPCIVVIDWIALPPRVALGRRELIISLAFPLAYLIYSLVRGKLTGWYPYPFLNAARAGGIAGVTAYVIGITLVVGVVGWALIALGNRRRRRLESEVHGRAQY